MKVANLFARLVVLFPQEFPTNESGQGWLTLYADVLHPYEGATLETAFDETMRGWTGHKAPKPADIRAKINVTQHKIEQRNGWNAKAHFEAAMREKDSVRRAWWQTHEDRIAEIFGTLDESQRPTAEAQLGHMLERRVWIEAQKRALGQHASLPIVTDEELNRIVSSLESIAGRADKAKRIETRARPQARYLRDHAPDNEMAHVEEPRTDG